MKYAIFLAPVLLAAVSVAAAAADKTPCIDPHYSYNARPLNRHEIFVRNGIGKPRPPLRLRTSCINLEPATGIGLSSSFGCIGLGDNVVASTIDGRRESCVVTGVLPYVPEKDDMHG